MNTDPWPEAVARLAAKRPVAARALGSAQWADVPLALRDRAFFSAHVGSAQVLAEMQARVGDALSLQDGAGRGAFVADLRRLLDAAPGDTGDLQDLTSYKRLELIFDMNKAEAQEHARWKSGLDQALLGEFPAQELVRIESRREERDWSARWAAAGAQVGWQGAVREPMVALKTSPIWAALSAFGRPWPPFDWGSGMGLDDVDREEAESLGLLQPGEPAPDGAAAQQDYNAELQASVRGLPDGYVEQITQILGDDVTLQDGAMRWNGDKLGDLWQKWTAAEAPATAGPESVHRLGTATLEAQAAAKRALDIDLAGWRLEVRGQELRHINRRHGADSEVPGGDQVSITEAEVRAIPQVWRAPDRVEWGAGPSAGRQAATPDGWQSGQLRMISDLGGEQYLGEYVADTGTKTLRLGSMWKKRKAAP